MKAKLIVLLTAVLICFGAVAQTAASTDVISTMRMGPFKLGSFKADVEKITGGKLIAIDRDDYYDTVKVTYNNSNYVLVFNSDYNPDPNAPVKMKLSSISCASTPLKTKSGIGIGSTKAQILAAYDKFDINIYNDYQYKEKKNARDKIQFINLQDYDAGTQIMFTTENRIVTAITVGVYEGD